MKQIKLFSILLGIGLGIALVLYPVLHEMGHVLVATMVGADVVEIKIFPIPNVLCKLNDIGHFEIAWIAFGGSVVPFILVACLEPKSFVAWYSCFTIKGISLLAFIIGLVSIFSFSIGMPVVNEDITPALHSMPYMAPIFGVIYIILMIIDIASIIHSKPLVRCESFMV